MIRRLIACAGLLALGLSARADDEPKPKGTQPPAGDYALTIPTNRFGKFDLIDVDLKGENPRRLTRDPRGAMEPAWSPDGKSLLFVSFRTKQGQIFRLDDGDESPRNLTKTEAYERNPVWSPDGKKVAFTSQRDGNQEVYVMGADGSSPKNLSQDDGFDADPCWSPDGKRIAFVSSRSGGSLRLWVMNADGSGPKELLDKDLYGWIYPAWSPDGKTMAMGALTEDRTIQLFLVEVASGEAKQLTTSNYLNSYASWSPDGKFLAYVHFDQPIPGFNPGEDFDPDDPGGDLMIYDIANETSTKVSSGDLPTYGPRPAFRPRKPAEKPKE